ncbi:MAG: HEAT repeat domain-containing protein [Thermoplasmatota archaeon]
MDYIEEVIKDLESTDSEKREKAVQLLEIIGSKDAEEALLEVLDDESARIRGLAAKALGNICELIPEKLLDLIEDDNFFVRGCAVEAIGKIGDEEAIDILVKKLNDKNGWVQDEAAKALIKIDEPEGLRKLKEWMKNYY